MVGSKLALFGSFIDSNSARAALSSPALDDFCFFAINVLKDERW
jgi:hypothetical protein